MLPSLVVVVRGGGGGGGGGGGVLQATESLLGEVRMRRCLNFVVGTEPAAIV